MQAEDVMYNRMLDGVGCALLILLVLFVGFALVGMSVSNF
jgi:hypothetical protein